MDNHRKICKCRLGLQKNIDIYFTFLYILIYIFNIDFNIDLIIDIANKPKPACSLKHSK